MLLVLNIPWVLNMLLVLNIPWVMNIPFPKYKKVPCPEV